jgi:hypothetical protein
MLKTSMLILGCLSVVGCNQVSAAPQQLPARFHIQPDKDGGIWRVDMINGNVSYCWFAAGGTNVGCKSITEPENVPNLK